MAGWHQVDKLTGRATRRPRAPRGPKDSKTVQEGPEWASEVSKDSKTAQLFSRLPNPRRTTGPPKGPARGLEQIQITEIRYDTACSAPEAPRSPQEAPDRAWGACSLNIAPENPIVPPRSP
eukprot:9493815-Pyramimonas_sp.AAC.3